MPGGRRSPIERQNFGVGGTPGALLGQWLLAYTIGTSTFGDRYVLNTVLGPTSGGNGVVSDGSTRVAFEYQVSGTLAGYVVGAQFNSSGTAIDQYLFELQLEEGRGVWVSPTTSSQYGMNVYKTHVASGTPKGGVAEDDLVAREGKVPAAHAKNVSIREREAPNPELDAITRQMWELLQQSR
jgi:hypothetical protein